MSSPKTTPLPRFVILAAIDLSEHAEGVLAAATQLSRGTPGAEIHIVNVLNVLNVLEPLELDDFGARAAHTKALTRQAEYLDAVAKQVSASSGTRVLAHLNEGVPWRSIVQTAANLDADLLVVGTHGRTGVARLVMGSVAEQVVRHAACTVHVVRPKSHVSARAPEIEPPCPDCLRAQRETNGAKIWCARHAEHHPRAHLHYEWPPGFGAGSNLIQSEG